MNKKIRIVQVSCSQVMFGDSVKEMIVGVDSKGRVWEYSARDEGWVPLGEHAV